MAARKSQRRISQRPGSPITDTTYYVAYDYCPEFLDQLPPNKELLDKIKASRRWPAFNCAIVTEDISLARQLLSEGVPINERILISYGMGNLCPIHYAVRNGNLAVMNLVLNAGADPNALTDQGKSPLRLVTENILLSNEQRRKAVLLLQEHGAEFTPPLSTWKERLAVLLGWPIAST